MNPCPHPKSLSQSWERDFEISSPSPNIGRRGWGMRASFAFVQEVYSTRKGKYCNPNWLDLGIQLSSRGLSNVFSFGFQCLFMAGLTQKSPKSLIYQTAKTPRTPSPSETLCEREASRREEFVERA